MRNGYTIVKFMWDNANKILGLNINGHPKDGFIEFTLLDKSTHKFDWDEEDQSLFECALVGREWKQGMKGLNSLQVRTEVKSLEVSADRPIAINVNEQPLEEWGTKVSTSHGLWKKRDEAPQQRANNNAPNSNHGASGLAKGWFGKM